MYIYTVWLEDDEKHNMKAGQSKICRVPRRLERFVKKHRKEVLGDANRDGTVISVFGEGQTIDEAKENAIQTINVVGRDDLKKVVELVNKTSKEIEILCVLENAKINDYSNFFMYGNTFQMPYRLYEEIANYQCKVTYQDKYYIEWELMKLPFTFATPSGIETVLNGNSYKFTYTAETLKETSEAIRNFNKIIFKQIRKYIWYEREEYKKINDKEPIDDDEEFKKFQLFVADLVAKFKLVFMDH